MASARRLVVNPADYTQRYILYGNGRIQALGGAPPIPQAEFGSQPSDEAVHTALPGSAGSRPAPTWYSVGWDTAHALQITDWSTPSGYVLSVSGKVYPFGAAADIPGDYAPIASGYPGYEDFVMDPAANGRGYLLTVWGDVIAIGSGVTAVPHAQITPDAVFGRLFMDWASKEYVCLDRRGRFFSRNGAPDISVGPAGPWEGDHAHEAPVWPWAYTFLTAAQIIDWDAGQGWMMDESGFIRSLNDADPIPGTLASLGILQYQDFVILQDGTGGDPLRFASLTIYGTMHDWLVSTAPSVSFDGIDTPADPTMDTTRPAIAWQYVDAENDAQALFEVRVFDEATYVAGGFDPDTSTAFWETSGIDRSVRGVTPAVDVPNGLWRYYVRVTDSSGLASAWAYGAWEQNADVFAIPTIEATDLGGIDGIDLALHVDLSSMPDDTLLAVQYHDADGSWAWVRDGLGLTPDGSGDATATDLEAPFGIERTYRALTYVEGAYRASEWSDEATATLTAPVGWGFTNPFDADQGGEVIVQDEGYAPTRTTVAGTFQPVGRDEPIVLSDGKPKAPSFGLKLWVFDATARAVIDVLLDAGVVLLLRSPEGLAWYVRCVGDIALAGDQIDLTVPLQAVRRPLEGPTVGPLADLVG